MGWSPQIKKATAIEKVDESQNNGDVESGTGKEYECKERVRFKKVIINNRQSQLIGKVRDAIRWLSSEVGRFVQHRTRTTRTEPSECDCKVLSEAGTATSPPSPIDTDEESRRKKCTESKPKDPRDMATPTSSYAYARASPHDWSSSEPFRSSEAQASAFKMASDDIARPVSIRHSSPPHSCSECLQKLLARFKTYCYGFLCLIREKVASLLRNAASDAPGNQGHTLFSPSEESTSTSTPALQSTGLSKPTEGSLRTSRETETPRTLDARDSEAAVQGPDCISPHQDVQSTTKAQKAASIHNLRQSSSEVAIFAQSSAYRPPHRSRLPIPSLVKPQRNSSSSPLRAITTSDEKCQSSKDGSGVDSLGRAWAKAGYAAENMIKRRVEHPTTPTEHAYDDRSEEVWCIEEDTPPEIRLPRYYVQGAYRGERRYQRKRRERFKNPLKDAATGDVENE
ncbi:hypothetical protein KEM54_003263 [Ascosphaera aggregata]|nr:hypothetical protein KEM54_003263 [Ascosphaera aggregata]